MKKEKSGDDENKKNFADNIQRVENMVHSHPFVQSVIHNKNTIPSVICYTEEHILDIRQFCVKGNCVLGFDKTFNRWGCPCDAISF